MSRPGHCDTCGTRVDHHGPSKHRDGHAFVCARDDEVRARRAARLSGANVYTGRAAWRIYESVDGCIGIGCRRGRHGPLWYRDHVYQPPSEPVLLERMRDRRAARILRRVQARGTWAYATVYMVGIDPFTVFTDEWDVTRTYGDWSTMLTVTRERLGISRFVAPTRDGANQWTLYSDREDVTVVIDRRVVGTLVRP